MEMIPEGAIAQAAWDPDMQRIVQERMALWRHARKCLRRQLKLRFHGIDRQCTLRNCSAMVSVLEHMRFCQNLQFCATSHCMSTKYVIRHWRDCGDYGCPLCGPSLINEMKPFRFLEPERHVKDWHQSVSEDHRRCIIQLLREKTYPIEADSTESKVYYKQATTRTEYYHLIAENMWQVERQHEYDRHVQQHIATAQAKLDAAIRRVQLRLRLVWHARECQHLLRGYGSWQCHQPYCSAMVATLEHLLACQNRENCEVSYCASTREILSHWEKCEHYECAVCESLVKQEVKAKDAKKWHKSVKDDQRRHLVDLLSLAAYDDVDRTSFLMDKTESDIYWEAGSRTEYFHLMAEKMWQMDSHYDDLHRSWD